MAIQKINPLKDKASATAKKKETESVSFFYQLLKFFKFF